MQALINFQSEKGLIFIIFLPVFWFLEKGILGFLTLPLSWLLFFSPCYFWKIIRMKELLSFVCDMLLSLAHLEDVNLKLNLGI